MGALQHKNSHLERVLREGLRLLEPLRKELSQNVLGMLAGAYESDAPGARSIPASALSIGEILRVYNLLAHLGVRYQDRALLV